MLFLVPFPPPPPSRYALTFCSNPSKLDALITDKLQGLVDVTDLMHSHLSPLLCWWDLLSRDKLQETKKSEAITKINIQLVYLYPDFTQVRIAPCSESLQTHMHTKMITIQYHGGGSPQKGQKGNLKKHNSKVCKGYLISCTFKMNDKHTITQQLFVLVTTGSLKGEWMTYMEGVRNCG